jgi:hypothetical protein
VLTEIAGDEPPPDTLVATVTAPVDVLNAPVPALKSIALEPLAATAPEKVVVPETPSVLLNVVAPVTPSVEVRVVAPALSVELRVVAPVTTNDELRVAAPVTPSVELSVVAPVTLRVELNDVGCARVTSVVPNVATATALVPTYTLPWLLPLPAPPIKLNEPPVLVPTVAAPP